ncbi:ABC transporter permease subunit [Halomonas sp. MCCC 1A11036]|uniref:ABC transporter permease subunit n=2 Tax=Billgrantia zhangzhouensis TaxID=2733481 RepID=A0ABS9AFW7_9GAMM|nr:ABC transporter permease subunit [Halomonas zhangzhouensis]
MLPLLLGLTAFVVFGPLINLAMWAFTEQWFFPNRFPSQWGFAFWERVFRPRAGAWEALYHSVTVALAAVALSLALAIPAAYALARLALPLRSLIMLVFLLPQAFPNLPIFVNIAAMFYGLGLNGTLFGVVLVHSLPGLVYAVWIATAAFSAVDRSLEEAARNLGAGPLRTFLGVTLPQALPGLIAASIFVFLDSIDEFTGTYFVGTPDITTLPILMFNASMGGNYQIAAITALILLVPSVGFMLIIERFLKADVLARIGR